MGGQDSEPGYVPDRTRKKKKENLPPKPYNDNCFVATATYGTSMNPNLEYLRAFRDNVLMPTELGFRATLFYYFNAEPVAQYINNHPIAGQVVRILLKPVIRTLKTFYGENPTGFLILGRIEQRK